jgi:hypothetical protein
MRQWQRWVFGAGLMAAGYALGATDALDLRRVGAQEATETGVSKETALKIKAATIALRDAADALRSEGRYEAITNDVNSFLVLSGGGNAREDLMSGAGVDPETFAALYAGAAIEEIQDQLAFDDQNRLTFNDQVVRMYSKARLQRMMAERTKLAETRQ